MRSSSVKDSRTSTNARMYGSVLLYPPQYSTQFSRTSADHSKELLRRIRLSSSFEKIVRIFGSSTNERPIQSLQAATCTGAYQSDSGPNPLSDAAMNVTREPQRKCICCERSFGIGCLCVKRRMKSDKFRDKIDVGRGRKRAIDHQLRDVLRLPALHASHHV